MTRDEMHNAIAVKLQKIDSFAFDNFLPEELDFMLNDAQIRIVKQRAVLRSDPKQAGFETNMRRLADIQRLVTLYSNDITEENLPDVGEPYSFTLPGDFLMETEMMAKYKRASDASLHDAKVNRMPVRVTENDRSFEDSMNPFRKPTQSSMVATIFGDNIMVNCNEKNIIVGLALKYIRKPQKISATLDCELPEHVHPEIVDHAVVQLLEALESKRYQSSKIEASTSE